MKKVVISGSAALSYEMNTWVNYWRGVGCAVIDWPKPIPQDRFRNDWPGVHTEFYRSLAQTDIHFVANEDKNGILGYIGVGVFAEIAFVAGLNLVSDRKINIFLLRQPSQEVYFYNDIALWLENGWLQIFDKTNVQNIL